MPKTASRLTDSEVDLILATGAIRELREVLLAVYGGIDTGYGVPQDTLHAVETVLKSTRSYAP